MSQGTELHAIGKTSKDHLEISQGTGLHAHLHNLIECSW